MKFFYIIWALIISLAFAVSARAADEPQETIFLVNGQLVDAVTATKAASEKREVYKCTLQEIKINKKSGSIGLKKKGS